MTAAAADTAIGNIFIDPPRRCPLRNKRQSNYVLATAGQLYTAHLLFETEHFSVSVFDARALSSTVSLSHRARRAA
jgi:hypothetical protein